ncbi:MAG TPA: efflux RND transporter periplasmic adaptor subunit [Verrucomicrobiae bacterium]|nr:efflux RND transporter periplasmic adaptor subunit [Verrucomicrobiae bacterium]
MKAALACWWLVFASAYLTGCGAKQESSQASSISAATVQAQTVESKSRTATEDEIGTVRPKLSASIEAKISGSIKDMLVVPGQAVKKGELLVELNVNEVHARYDQAAAELKQAELDWKRTSQLYNEQSASRAEYDNADARYRVAQGAMSEAETMMSYSEIHAPFDGVVTRKDADVGDLATPGKPLLEMEDPEHLRMEADVPEELRARVKFGDSLLVNIEALDTNLAGIVSEISPSSDPNSRTFVAKLDLPQTPGLRSGQFGRVAVPSGEVATLRVPISAVIQRGDMDLLFVVASDHAQLRIVKTGARVGDEVEIVSGLDSGERVVVSPPNNLLDGQPVVVSQ